MGRCGDAGKPRRNVDDTSIVANMVSDGLNKKEGPLQIYREGFVKDRLTSLREGKCRGNACVVDENVEPWLPNGCDRSRLKLLPDLVCGFLAFLQVCLDRHGFCSKRLDLAHGRVGRIRIARVMHADKTRALLRQRQRRSAANPP